MFDSIAVPFEKVELRSPTRPATQSTKPLLNLRSCNKYTPILEMEKSLIDIAALRRKKGGVFPIPLVRDILSVIVLVCLVLYNT